jgi:hypothetical protein
MGTSSRRIAPLCAAAATLVVVFAMIPNIAAADIGPLQITSGDLIFTNTSAVSGNGFTADITAAPELLSNSETISPGSAPLLNFCFGCGLPGTDDGVGTLGITSISDPALTGLTQIFGPEGYVESGGLTVSQPFVVTGPGIYSAPFTLAAKVDYGPPGSMTDSQATQFVDIVGSGTVTADFVTLANQDGRLAAESLEYSFVPPSPPARAPEIDPGSAASGLTLLLGGLLVLRGRRQRTPA